MSGADIAMLAIHLVLDHDRASVLQRQLREIDLLMPAAGGGDHLDRLCSGAHSRRSIEYCEDVLAHLRCVADLRAAVDAARQHEDLLSRYVALNSRAEDASNEVRYASYHLRQHERNVTAGLPSVRVALAHEALGLAAQILDGTDRRQ